MRNRNEFIFIYACMRQIKSQYLILFILISFSDCMKWNEKILFAAVKPAIYLFTKKKCRVVVVSYSPFVRKIQNDNMRFVFVCFSRWRCNRAFYSNRTTHNVFVNSLSIQLYRSSAPFFRFSLISARWQPKQKKHRKSREKTKQQQLQRAYIFTYFPDKFIFTLTLSIRIRRIFKTI